MFCTRDRTPRQSHVARGWGANSPSRNVSNPHPPNLEACFSSASPCSPSSARLVRPFVAAPPPRHDDRCERQRLGHLVLSLVSLHHMDPRAPHFWYFELAQQLHSAFVGPRRGAFVLMGGRAAVSVSVRSARYPFAPASAPAPRTPPGHPRPRSPQGAPAPARLRARSSAPRQGAPRTTPARPLARGRARQLARTWAMPALAMALETDLASSAEAVREIDACVRSFDRFRAQAAAVAAAQAAVAANAVADAGVLDGAEAVTPGCPAAPSLLSTPTVWSGAQPANRLLSSTSALTRMAVLGSRMHRARDALLHASDALVVSIGAVTPTALLERVGMLENALAEQAAATEKLRRDAKKEALGERTMRRQVTAAIRWYALASKLQARKQRLEDARLLRIARTTIRTRVVAVDTPPLSPESKGGSRRGQRGGGGGRGGLSISASRAGSRTGSRRGARAGPGAPSQAAGDESGPTPSSDGTTSPCTTAPGSAAASPRWVVPSPPLLPPGARAPPAASALGGGRAGGARAPARPAAARAPPPRPRALRKPYFI